MPRCLSSWSDRVIFSVLACRRFNLFQKAFRVIRKKGICESFGSILEFQAEIHTTETSKNENEFTSLVISGMGFE